MKIGFFTDSYFPEIDGVTYTIKLWRERLEQLGHEVYVIYPAGDYEPGDREIPVKSLPNPIYAGYRIPLFRRPSTLPELDIVHCHSPAAVSVLGRYYAWKHGLPTMYTHHTPVEEYFHQGVKSKSVAGAIAKLYLPMENNFLQSFDAVTASTEQIDRNVDHIPLPVGIDMEFFRPTDEDWYPDRTVVGYSGRISPEKNVDEVLQAAARLPEYEFVIVGEGPCRDSLREAPPENVQFRDFLPREKLPKFYSSIDAFVTASRADTLGLSTLEANACGTPVAAADVAPFDRTIGPENGERFGYGSIDGMIDAIEDCLAEPHDTRAAAEQYDVRRTIDQLTELYQRISRSADGMSATDEEDTNFSAQAPAK